MMNNQDLIESYNYDEFVPEKFEQWLDFEHSPELGIKAPDFPLWQLDGIQTQLLDVLSSSLFTVVEFGSFT